MKHKCQFCWHSLVVYMCRYHVEPFIQRQPEGETGQRDTSWAHWEDPHPSVRRRRRWGHPADPFWGRNLLQHHRMPQVPLTYLCLLSVVAARSFVKMYFSLCLLVLPWLHLHFGNLYWQDSPLTVCVSWQLLELLPHPSLFTLVCKSLHHSSLQLLCSCSVYAHPGGFLSPNELPFGEYFDAPCWTWRSGNTLPHSFLFAPSGQSNDMHDSWLILTWNSSDLSLSLCVVRNLSSVNEKTRQQMRETQGLVDCLVGYIKASLNENKTEDKVSQETMELNVSRCFCSTQVLCIHLLVCVCVFVGGGKCSVCPEEPLLPALRWDASICSDAPGRTNQSSGLRKWWRHWLLHTSEQESQKCTHTWD